MRPDGPPTRGRLVRGVVLLVLALVLASCSGGSSGGGDESGGSSDGPAGNGRVLAVGDTVMAGEATATVTSVEAVEATAEVFAAEGDRVVVEVSVCGTAEDVAGLWTLHVGDDVLEPVPLPPAAVEGDRPTFDFTAGPDADGCRSGWVAWDAPPGEDGLLVWEGDPEVGWSSDPPT